ncbi:MAG: NADH-quinone oxidoreductase subunit H, partial [Vicinamibacterales bacterium]|nr:NADH-quinone oxidoreductase subunit H [Vicinamibacterales bacterium]
MVETVIVPLIMVVTVLAAVLVTVMYIVLLERKVQAWVQVRLGPMRVGPHGILQPLADVLKLFAKEDITPARADKWVFTAAPIIVLVPALIAFAVIPFASGLTLFGISIPGRIADVNVGLLYIISVAGIGIYGIILGGWSSNSKYPLLASLRSSAQLISYEIAVTMTLVTVIMLSGTLSMVGIVDAQLSKGWWFAFMQPVAFAIYVIGSLAETNRAPFDLPEAEQELVAGFHTEYSGMRFA